MATIQPSVACNHMQEYSILVLIYCKASGSARSWGRAVEIYIRGSDLPEESISITLRNGTNMYLIIGHTMDRPRSASARLQKVAACKVT